MVISEFIPIIFIKIYIIHENIKQNFVKKIIKNYDNFKNTEHLHIINNKYQQNYCINFKKITIFIFSTTKLFGAHFLKNISTIEINDHMLIIGKILEDH